MEAAASGLPVVATDIRGCRQVVDTGVTGELVALGAPAALTEALRSYGDPGRRRSHGIAAREKAERSFDEQPIVERVLRAYNGAARRERNRTAR